MTEKKKPNIGLDDFQDLDLRVGRVVSVEPHPSADRLYIVDVDLGEKNEDGSGKNRRLVAGVRPWYAPGELTGRQVVIVANLEPATIRGVKSEGMLLAVRDGEKLSLVTLDQEVSAGARVS